MCKHLISTFLQNDKRPCSPTSVSGEKSKRRERGEGGGGGEKEPPQVQLKVGGHRLILSPSLSRVFFVVVVIFFYAGEETQ